MSTIATPSSMLNGPDRRPALPWDVFDGEYLVHRVGVTLDDYLRWANEDTRLDLIDGVLTMHSPANVRHEDMFWFLGILMRSYVGAKRLGKVLGSRTAVILGDGRRVEPDLLFLANEHLALLDDVWLNGPADLVVEIMSPSTRDHDLGRKREAYRDANIPELWIIDPIGLRLMVDRPAGVRATEMKSGRYDCHVIPGFWIEVAWLWANPLPSAEDCLKHILGAPPNAT